MSSNSILKLDNLPLIQWNGFKSIECEFNIKDKVISFIYEQRVYKCQLLYIIRNINKWKVAGKRFELNEIGYIPLENLDDVCRKAWLCLQDVTNYPDTN